MGDMMKEQTTGTSRAREYVNDPKHSLGDVQANWWEMFSNYRIKRWKVELDKLVQETGTSLQNVSDYLGTSYSDGFGFYRKLPKTRSTYIAIGMAFKQPLSTINRWITKFGGKKKLYIKDVLEDLVWIYLIEANCADDSDKNWYAEYDAYREAAIEAYNAMWDISIDEDIDTNKLEDNFKYVTKTSDPMNLKDFINDNIDAFKTAYAKPRHMLETYLNQILSTLNAYSGNPRKTTLNSLRGYLDDSMINYLSGQSGVVNVLDRTKNNRTPAFKHIPKNRSTHIYMCMSLGMTVNEIDKYLDLMGYAPMDATNKVEGMLINLLNKWENEHPVVAKYKDKHFKSKEVNITPKEELQAVTDMLQLRKNDGYNVL